MKIFITSIAMLFSFCLIAQPGSWKQIGTSGGWANTKKMTMINGMIYSVDNSGALYETVAATGVWKKLGSAYGNTSFMFAGNTFLYTIETSGSLYIINRTDGSWKRLGNAGAWIGTIAGTVLNGNLYTAEKSGALYVTDPATGAWKQLGTNAFGATVFMGAGTSKLYTIESSGTLYEVNVK